MEPKLSNKYDTPNIQDESARNHIEPQTRPSDDAENSDAALSRLGDLRVLPTVLL